MNKKNYNQNNYFVKIIKILFCFTLIFCTLLSSNISVFSSNTGTKSHAKAYIDVINKYEDGIKKYNFPHYQDECVAHTGEAVALTDITGDNVPELFFIYFDSFNGYSSNNLMIWTYLNGKSKLLLHEKGFDIDVAAGHRYCIYLANDNSLIIHNGIGDESWTDEYSKFIYKSGKLNLSQKLSVKAAYTDSTYDDGKYTFYGQLTQNGKTTDISYKKSSEWIISNSKNSKEIILSNYWSDKYKMVFCTAMNDFDKKVGEQCWGGSKPKISENYTYQKIINKLNSYNANNSSDDEMMEYAEKLWDKQYNMIWSVPPGAWYGYDEDANNKPIESNGKTYWLIEKDNITSLKDIQADWENYFTDDFVDKSFYLKNYIERNNQVYTSCGGIGGDITLVSFDFIRITEQKWNKITFLVREVRDENQDGNRTSKEFYYTIVFEDKTWKCSEAVYTDGTPFISRFGVDSALRTEEIDFGDGIKLDLKWGWSLFDKNASEYDHNLAMAGLVLSRATYSGGNDVENKLKQLGFDIFEYSSLLYNIDVIHQPARTIAAQKVKINDEEKIVITVVVRGTSNLTDLLFTDVSACFSGFLDAGTNVMNHLDDYYIPLIEKQYGLKLSKDNTVFFLTGHSLGGAVSGVLSYKVLKYAKQENIFTYTYASPNHHTEANYASYKNVHNIINTGDQVPNVPWGQKRYGNDWYYSLDTCIAELEKMYGPWETWFEKYFSNPIDSILFQHDMKSYLACLLSGVPKNIGDGAKSEYNLSSIHCPVDITVYDENGIEMGYTTDSKVTLSKDSEVLIYTDGDSKFVISPPDKKYTIKFTATDNGTMTFIPSRIETVSRTTINEKEFSNVKLTKGKVMIAEIGGDVESDDIRLFVQNENGKNIAEILPDGSEKELNSLFGSDGLSVGDIVIISIFALLLVGGGIIVVVFASKRKNEDIEILQDDNTEQTPEIAVEDTFIIENSNDIDAAIKILNGTMNGFTLPIKDGDTLYLGKDPTKANIIFSSDYKNVSRIHCSVSYDKNTNKYFVIDCSSNGTYFENHNRFVKGKRTCVNRNTVILLANDDCSVLLK